MTRILFRALIELKSDIIVVDKPLETTSTANYSKTHTELKRRTCKICLYYYYI